MSDKDVTKNVEEGKEMSDKEVTKNVEEVEEGKEPEIKKGIVRNCELLNVRKEPNTNSDIIKVINHGDEINIIKEDKGIMSADFYKTTDGYVMKKYIKIIQ